jgi:hypothetical protein
MPMEQLVPLLDAAAHAKVVFGYWLLQQFPILGRIG